MTFMGEIAIIFLQIIIRQPLGWNFRQTVCVAPVIHALKFNISRKIFIDKNINITFLNK